MAFAFATTSHAISSWFVFLDAQSPHILLCGTYRSKCLLCAYRSAADSLSCRPTATAHTLKFQCRCRSKNFRFFVRFRPIAPFVRYCTDYNYTMENRVIASGGIQFWGCLWVLACVRGHRLVVLYWKFVNTITSYKPLVGFWSNVQLRCSWRQR